METTVAALVLLITVAYAVFIAVSIEKGKRWAVEIARAISVLDPQTVSYDLNQRVLESVSARPDRHPAAAPVESASERLAA